MISNRKPTSSITAVFVSRIGAVGGVGIALSVILVTGLAFLSTTISSSYATVSSTTNMTTSTTTTAEGQKPVAAGTSTTQMFAIQNTSTSIPDSTPGHEQAHQMVIALPARDDGKLYTGTVTYTSSHPVEVIIFQQFNLNQTTTGGEEGGTVTPLLTPSQEEAIALIHELEGDQFDNLNFAGSSLWFHSRNPEPFTVTYTIVGELVEPTPLPTQ